MACALLRFISQGGNQPFLPLMAKANVVAVRLDTAPSRIDVSQKPHHDSVWRATPVVHVLE